MKFINTITDSKATLSSLSGLAGLIIGATVTYLIIKHQDETSN